METSRYERTSELIPDKIFKTPVAIIGLGAIGRQVALQLAASGIQSLILVDHDTVDLTNLATQGYKESQLGQLKVEATRNDCLANNSELEVIAHPTKYKKGMELAPTIFCCVDSIDTRVFIWKHAGLNSSIFIDGRMAAEVMRIITAEGIVDNQAYMDTVFVAEEAQGGQCTAKATIYCANIAAGLMVCEFTKHLRGFPNTKDFTVNLLSGEIIKNAA